MKMPGVLVEKVPKTYFVGVASTLFAPLRDTISVSNNRLIFSGISDESLGRDETYVCKASHNCLLSNSCTCFITILK